MARKKAQKVHINVTIDEGLNEWVEKTATEYNMTKSQLINNLVSMGKDDVVLMKATGVLGMAKVARKIKEEVLRFGVKGVSAKRVGDRE